MSSQVRPWIPGDAASAPAVRARAAAAIEAWSTRWFVQRQIVIHGWRMAPSIDWLAASDEAWRVPRKVLAVRCPALTRARLLSWALDANIEEQESTTADQAVLETFLARIVDDLADELETALEVSKDPDAPIDGAAVLIIDLADANGLKLLSLAAPLETVVALRKRLAGAPAAARGGLTPILTAAASAEVTLDVVVGRARAGLADVRALAPGDVLVLETPLDTNVHLVGPGGVVAGARLIEHEGERALALQSLVKSASNP